MIVISYAAFQLIVVTGLIFALLIMVGALVALGSVYNENADIKKGCSIPPNKNGTGANGATRGSSQELGMDMTSPLMIVVYIIASIITIALGLVGWNVRANRRRRAKLVDAMQRSRFGRTK